MLHCFEYCEAAGLIINKEMKRLITEENKENNAFKKKIPDFELIENIKVFFLIFCLFIIRNYSLSFCLFH